jgi:hypothetical protein
MNHTQQRRRRPLVAMPGHALALAWQHRASHVNDAHRMHVLERLRQSGSVNTKARHNILAFGR